MILHDLGVFFCREADDAFERLNFALKEAERLGVSGQSYQLAKSYYDRETGFFGTKLTAGSGCSSLVDEINARLSQLNADISRVGGTSTPAALTASAAGGGLFSTGWLKPVLIAAVVIAGLAAVGYATGGVAKILPRRA